MSIQMIFRALHDWAESSLLFYPLILSLLSATIFWSAFSLLPFRKRYAKMRPIVELEMYNAYQRVFGLFDVVFAISPHSPSLEQRNIRGGRLTKEEIEIALQNKCLNESYLYDPTASPQLMIVGDTLGRMAVELDGLVDKILTFMPYTKDREVILLDKIRHELRRYDFSEKDVHRNSATRMGTTEYRPANPSISYRTQSLVEIYALYLELQDIVLRKNHYLDRDVAITSVQYFYEIRSFRKCQRLARKYSRAFPNDRDFLDSYHLLCHFHVNNASKFRRELDVLLSRRPYSGSLVSIRSLVREIRTDLAAMETIKRYYPDHEIEETQHTIDIEDRTRQEFVMQNRALLAHYTQRTPDGS